MLQRQTNSNTPFTWWSWLDDLARPVNIYNYSMFARRLLDVCSMFARSCKRGITNKSFAFLSCVYTLLPDALKRHKPRRGFFRKNEKKCENRNVSKKYDKQCTTFLLSCNIRKRATATSGGFYILG